MPRNLVVCCDGTWCSPEQQTGLAPSPTNVVKLYNLCLADAGQLTYYHPGVGTEGNLVERLLGGGIGLGLDGNILSAYHWLCDNYRSGDRIYLFGFSRGAYTVRSLGGMIAHCGLLDLGGLDERKSWQAIRKVYEHGYRKREAPEKWRSRHTFLHGDLPDGAVGIHLIGVWDTVGALGVPDELVGLDQMLDDPRRYRFHDTELSPGVRHARHAVAMDERRASFAPTLWTGEQRPPESSLQQLWFAGTHSDVGGGYPECGLSDGTLQWMVDEATALGLRIDPALASQLAPDSRGVLHDSTTGVWRLLRTLPRAAPPVAAGKVGTELHRQVWERHQLPPLAQAPYWPTRLLAAGEAATIAVFAREHWNFSGLYLEAGVRYDLAARGEWLDSSVACGPGGVRDGFNIGEVAYLLGDAIGEAEAMYKRLTGKQGADWWGSRRRDDAPWFALIGMIANQPSMDGSGTAIEGETFLIGDHCTWTPERSGYLYCYANDAWTFYGNNRGQVTLTVKRP
ncbi:MAG TPA: DUF2235 domain-containing protein [Accumulibacter sp.]|uniref:DUF2235 domain-containing protein n=1 Tax=Accumulibacter sp. TaxID=2053492 RepID=UPI0025EF2E7F|nr:DUF2235 domain-containing protein [Accumulibacter sp.]MCM8597980.1 DUF2235 domain-containing protein [Accumulibacter sp.]MCM8662135.1 DUF2235 domain-containing protein [Accumulibacter sp.]HNC52124.1 DUF2235 domain-containing protein [Accumulibacter sp.]